MALREKILALYDDYPFEQHPYWQGVLNSRFDIRQIMQAETQHYIRSSVGRAFRKKAAEESAVISQKAHDLLMETYLEECTDEKGPSHVGLIKRFLVIGGVSEAELDIAVTTPGNAAAIALYKDIGERGPLHHMIGAGAVEYYYSGLSPKVFAAYTEKYGLTPEQAETYRLHGPMDKEHAERALSILDEEPVATRESEILLAVRDAFVATSLHYDGMYQAATGTLAYWSKS